MKLSFYRQAKVTVADVPQFGMRPELARRMDDTDLFYYPEARTNDRPGGAMCQAELRRREGRTARTAVWISAVALIVSIVAIVAR